MKPITARTLSLVGFAASQWASERLNGSKHRRQYRELVAAGLALHESGELYASAPKMRRALATIAKHAAPLALVAILAGCQTAPEPLVREGIRMVPVQVATTPPGAIIEYNNEVVGVSPCTIKIPATPDGCWRDFQRAHVLRAEMADYSDWEYKEYNAGAPIPQHVVFILADAQRRYMQQQRWVR